MKNLLIVVDYQNDFVTGSLGFPKALALEDNIRQKIESYRKNADEVVFTFDTHDDNYLDTQEGKNLPLKHCIRDTEGWKLYGSIADLQKASDKCFLKNSFGSAELFNYLQSGNYEHIELVGVVTNICVISNAILVKTALPEVPVIVDTACVASNDESLNHQALNVMKSLQVKVL